MKKSKLHLVLGILLFIIILFTAMVIGGMYKTFRRYSDVTKEITTQSQQPKIDRDNAYNGTGIPEEIPQEVLEKYIEYMNPADDEYDYKYASDYQYYQLVKLKKAYDSSGYEQLLGYSDVTLEEIKQSIEANKSISRTYKDFVYEFACNLRRLYPEVNLAVLNYNIQTLIIDEVSQEEIDKETLSSNSAACYLRKENRILVLQDLDLSIESDDYIILVHELCHAARSISKEEEDGLKLSVGFYEHYQMGTYAEEGIITNIAYELQGLGKKATFYPMLASYYRIICDCIGYTGEDFFNHSVNYLIEKMDDYMGDEQYAYQIVAMIDAQMSLRYTPYQEVDFHEFLPMYEYIAKMYFKTHIREDMTEEEAKTVFNNFYEDITFNFENMNRKYDINEDTFMPVFEGYMENLQL
ncbi:MAG: hypothetical protein IKY94_08850 [Lachnospiraceae bacterium]|nr:hypothetical protein [Lachnospiraceae bacterium]